MYPNESRPDDDRPTRPERDNEFFRFERSSESGRGAFGAPTSQDSSRVNRRSVIAVTAAGVAMAVLCLAAWAFVHPGTGSAGVVAGPWIDPSPTVSDSMTATPTDVATTTAAPTPAPTHTTARPRPRPTPSKKPPASVLPPPPPPPKPACTTGSDPGPDLPRSQVANLLASAGAQHYWVGVTPSDPAIQPDDVSIPTDLMDAVAWTESSWRSTVVSCDGGVGLMQIMAPTQSWENQRFGTSYSSADPAGNVALGAQYLEWLTVYFGYYY
jgi:hypothetical protein